MFDLLTPVAQLTPGGTVSTVLLTPIAPNGSTTAFPLTIAHSGAPTNVAKNEELAGRRQWRAAAPWQCLQRQRRLITFAEAPEADAIVFTVWFGPAGA